MSHTPTPLSGFQALDGCHCQSGSMAKLYHHAGHPLSEEMLLGLGSGMGFFYWQQKGAPPFLGGRTNLKEFYTDIGERSGVKVVQKTSSSPTRAEKRLQELLTAGQPVLVHGDMFFLPWFDFSGGEDEYHFGAHAFVVCGYDGEDTYLAADNDPKQTDYKHGHFHRISRKQLGQARNSLYKPFPPKNLWLELDFSGYHDPTADDIYRAIAKTTEHMLHCPISNGGVRGIRRSAKEIMRWPTQFDEQTLRLNLFNVYIFIEIGGTGGGCFRKMYGRFLKEAAAITGDQAIAEAGRLIGKSGELFSAFGLRFTDILEADDVHSLLHGVPEALEEIYQLEHQAFTLLEQALPRGLQAA